MEHLDQKPWEADAASATAAIRTLHQVSKRVHSSLDLIETLDAVAQGVTVAAGFECAVVNLRRPDGRYEVVAVSGPPEVHEALMGTHADQEAWDELCVAAERWGTLMFVDHRQQTPPQMTHWVPSMQISDDPLDWHPNDCLFAPLLTPTGDWVGVLSIDVPMDGRRPGRDRLELLQLFVEHATIAVLHSQLYAEVIRTREQLDHLATHDPLTGLPNRELLRRTVGALAPDGDRIGVLVIDLDGFKQVNDTAGHDAGDEVLRVVAGRMARVARACDLLARTGGDEFVVVVTGPDVPDALPRLVADLKAAAQEPVPTGSGPQQVGASIGFATGVLPCDFSALLDEADRRMYRDKRAR